ncbi:MAG: RNA polymerase sigma-70 factor [Tannerella sp.]|jgi:RNA polymerase sigma-70 factor (ECF subfamily)|nr:RNA polymerase sigma-70 factor [Tannerella sp.]
MDSTDIQRFNRLYRDCRSWFIRLAETYVEDSCTAEDIVMDSLAYYWENRHLLQHEDHLPAYVLAVIKSKCINHLQRKRTREEAESCLHQRAERELSRRIATMEACNPEKLFADEVQQLIDETLSSLSVQSRDIFIRSKYGNQTNRDIADALKLSVKSVEYHMTKTLKRLRAVLKDYLPLLSCFILMRNLLPFDGLLSIR